MRRIFPFLFVLIVMALCVNTPAVQAAPAKPAQKNAKASPKAHAAPSKGGVKASKKTGNTAGKAAPSKGKIAKTAYAQTASKRSSKHGAAKIASRGGRNSHFKHARHHRGGGYRRIKHPEVVQSNAEAERKADEALREIAQPGAATSSHASAPPSSRPAGDSSAQSFYDKGMEMGRQNHFNQALDEFNQAIKLDPQNPSYYAGRGHSHFMLNQLDDAQRDYNKAIELNPSDTLSLTMRGHTYLKLGHANKAVADYTTAIQQGATEADVYSGRGTAYRKLSQTDKMCADFKTACDKNDCEWLENAKKSGLCQ